MTARYKVDFAGLGRESPMAGGRHEYIDRDGLRVRLVEYSNAMPPHCCDRGHSGFLVEGRMEIEFDGGTVAFEPGDGIVIPDGSDHRHRGEGSFRKGAGFLHRTSLTIAADTRNRPTYNVIQGVFS